MARLGIIIGSVREGRGGKAVSAWFTAQAVAHGKFDIEVIDLKALALPMLDEPNHPRFRKYTHEHTIQWSRTVEALDAFVFVTPEYNHGTPPALINAIDYLHGEWQYKPAGLVSYGGVSGGLRSVQNLHPILTVLKVMPLPEDVVLPFYAQYLDKNTDVFTPPEASAKAAVTMLDELVRWSDALRTLRPA